MRLEKTAWERASDIMSEKVSSSCRRRVALDVTAIRPDMVLISLVETVRREIRR